MQRRISTRIGLLVGALLLCTLVLQVSLMRMVTEHDVAALRARAGAMGLKLFALGITGGPFDAQTLERTFADGPNLGVYDAEGHALSRSGGAPAQLSAAVLGQLRATRDPGWDSQDSRLHVLRLPETARPAHYLSLSDGHVEAQLRVTRLKVLGMVTLVSALVGLSASLWFSHLIRRKLLVARETVKRVAEGELSVRFVPGSDDELGQLSLDFNRMAERLGAHIQAVHQEEARLRRIFADWTHEIATPLTSVLGYLEALAEGGLDPERQRRYLAQARGQARALERLVEDLTVLSQLESEGLEITRVPADLVPLIHAELDASRLRAPRLEVRSELTGSAQCEVDAQRLGQVLRNVLSNAERHARSRIVVSLHRTGDGAWQVEIADDGLGIAPEHLALVTESFYRVDESRDRNTGGRGLGLAIAKRLVDAHGGTLTVSSVVGEGTRVHITLPSTAPRP